MRSIPPIKCICSAANNWFNCAPLNGKPRSNCESGNLIQTWCNIERGGIRKSPPGDIVSIFGACESMAVRERYQVCLFAFPSPVFCLKFLPDMLPLDITYMYIIPCFESFFWIIDPDLMHYWGRQWPCCDNCVVKMLLTRKTENGQDPSR